MIDKTILALIPSEYYAEGNPLLKHPAVKPYLTTVTCNDLYYHEPLRQIFTKEIVYDYPKRMIKVGVKGINQELVELVRKEHPQYLLWSSGRWDFQPSTFDTIRKEGTIVIGLFYDDEVRFDEYSRWWIPHLDYAVTASFEAMPKYEKAGGCCILSVPLMGGIAVERDWSRMQLEYGVTFVGTISPVRERYIERLKDSNIQVSLFGGHSNPIPFQEMLDIFGASKINLNFSKAEVEERDGKVQVRPSMKGRIFDVCLAGGFLLTEYLPSIENYFEIDREIVCFQDAEEMISKITYYLQHETERKTIAEAGWKRACSEYNGVRMLSKMFAEIGSDFAIRATKTIPKRHWPNMPMTARKRFANYHFQWGKAFLLEDYQRLWKGSLALSLKYDPFNLDTWCYAVAGHLPNPLRSGLIKVYQTVRAL